MPGFKKNYQRKNHIRFAFLFRNKSEIKFSRKNQWPQYLFGYVTDDNKIFYDEFMIRNIRVFKRGTVLSFIKKVIKKRYIDEKTRILYYFGQGRYKSTDVMYMLWYIYQHSLKFTMNRIHLGVLISRLDIMFNLHLMGKTLKVLPNKMGFGIANDHINTIFLTALENRICPWITYEFNEKLERIRPHRRRMYKFVSLGLFYMCMTKYKTFKTAKNAIKKKILEGTDII